MNQRPHAGERTCGCMRRDHQAAFVVVTGGPGAGKTAIVEMAQKHFCQHTAVLPESASIVFGGGFWRLQSESARRAAQRAIFHVQREMEQLIADDGQWALALCDRGTLDGVAYWPGDAAAYWRDVGSGPATELSRYAAVIHLRTPGADEGYNYQNILRVETPEQARLIDERIAQVWSAHPRYVEIPHTPNFFVKASLAIEAIAQFTPPCCHLPE